MQNNGVPMINGEVYSWAMVKLMIGGVHVDNVTSVSYGDEQEVTPVYGAGRYPVGFGKGRITCSGSITLLKEEVVALQRSVLNGRLQDIPPFDILVSFVHPQLNKVVTDVLKNCMFTSNSVDTSEGDTSVSVSLPLMVSSIKWASK